MSLPTNLTYPSKVYLSGSDCFHLMLETHAKKYHAGGNVVRIAFFLDNEVTINNIITNINRSPIVHWLCNVTLVKGSLTRIPYWKYMHTHNLVDIYQHDSIIDNEIPISITSRDIKVTAKKLVEFDIIHYTNNKSAFVMSWNHTIMDGRGAGMLIKHLNEDSPVTQEDFTAYFPVKEIKTPLFQYIKNMYEVKHFIETSSKAPISNITSNLTSSTHNTFNHKIIQFNNTETQRIDDNAIKNGAKFGINIFLISCCSHIIQALQKKRGTDGVLWLPIPYDGRRRGAIGPIITNCVLFLFYRILPKNLTTIKETVRCVNEQMIDQIKTDMPKKYNMLLNMMRHIPLRLYHFLTNKNSENVFASFLYTSTGENIHDMKTLINKPINDVVIFPPQTFPPGLTFSFLRHNNILKLNIAYSEQAINDEELNYIETKIKELLLGDY